MNRMIRHTVAMISLVRTSPPTAFVMVLSIAGEKVPPRPAIPLNMAMAMAVALGGTFENARDIPEEMNIASPNPMKKAATQASAYEG